MTYSGSGVPPALHPRVIPMLSPDLISTAGGGSSMKYGGKRTEDRNTIGKTCIVQIHLIVL